MRAFAVVAGLAVLLSACGNCRKSEPARKEPPAPRADAAPPVTPGQKFRAALGRARTHEVRQEWPAAVAAYREALAISPDAPRALDALAHSLLGAGDLEAATATAIAATVAAADVKSASLAYFTLSRVLDQAGDGPGAARAIRRAHDLYARGETRTALGKVHGKPPAGFISPMPVAGPYASLADACTAQTPATPPPGWACKPDQGTDIGINKVMPDSGPFAEARIFEAGTAERSDCLLAMRIGTQWWIDELMPACRSPKTSYASKDLSLATPQSGGPPHLFVRGELTARWTEFDSDGIEQSVEDLDAFAVLCGVGPSKAPSCTAHAPIGSRRVTTQAGAAPATSEFKLEFGLASDGGVKLGSKSPDTLDKPIRELLGVHPLAWW